MLDAAYGLFGGVADVHLATTLSWFRKASTLLLLVNIVEATIRLSTNSLASDGGAVAIQKKRKPSLANPPGRVPSSQYSPAPSPLGKRNTPRHYAQGSPLRESIFRASASAQGLGEGRRLPSQSPSFEMGRKSSASATPLAAFLARKQERLTSGGGDVGDLSWDGGDAGVFSQNCHCSVMRLSACSHTQTPSLSFFFSLSLFCRSEHRYDRGGSSVTSLQCRV